MFCGCCNPSENSSLADFSYCLIWFLLISNYHGRFYKMRVSWNLTFTTFLSPFINTVLSFLTDVDNLMTR